MSFKTIFIIVLTVLITVILVNNTDEMDFWIFGNARVPKLVIFGVMFLSGLIIGYLAGKPQKKYVKVYPDFDEEQPDLDQNTPTKTLSDEDRDYIR